MIILLDIDGVMVVGNSWKRPEILEDGFPNFTTKAVFALNHIIDETGAQIILTTSHKSTYSINVWQNIFQKRGIMVSTMSKLNDNFELISRKDEILNWITQNPKNADFIIIDDDKSLNGLPSTIKNKLIQTQSSVGLTKELALEALKMIDLEFGSAV